MRRFRHALAIVLALSAFAVSPYRHTVKRLLRVLIGFLAVVVAVSAAHAKPVHPTDGRSVSLGELPIGASR